MTNDLDRVTLMAEEILGDGSKRLPGELTQYHFSKPELLAFEQAVLAKRDSQYWDAESAAKEMDRLQVKLAQQAEALNTAIIIIDGAIYVGHKLNNNGEEKLVGVRIASVTNQ